MEKPIFELCKVAFAGLAATFLMTFFIKICAGLFKRDFYVPLILGNVLLLKTPILKLRWGIFMHYGIGVALAALCLFSWRNFEMIRHFVGVLLMGAIAGVAAVLAWWALLRSSQATLVSDVKSYLVFIFSGHIIFTLTSWLIWIYTT